MISELMEYSEDARIGRRVQYGVRLTYADGRVRNHIAANEAAATGMLHNHLVLMVSEPDWGVTDATLIARTIIINIGEWEEAE